MASEALGRLRPPNFSRLPGYTIVTFYGTEQQIICLGVTTRLDGKAVEAE